MHPPGSETVLVRFSGELGVKSTAVQTRMERRVQENIGALLADRDLDADLEYERTRLYVHTDAADIEAVTAAVTDTFGVVSASPAVAVDPTLPAICDALGTAAQTHYTDGSFAVRARRAGQESAHPFSSSDIQEEGGAAVWESATARGVDPTVDLDDPDITFFVECRPERAFVFLEKQAGPGGLPLGTQEPLVALLSGGIDSPVAAWEVMRRGSPLYPLYIDLGDYGGVDHRLRVEEVARTLGRYVPDDQFQLRVAPGGDGFDRIVETTESMRMLVARRFMFRIAEHVADAVDAVGIVTGEAIGQKSSQTAASLGVTSAVTELPIHRPLVSTNKSAITATAKDIGTYDDATIDAGCHRLSPDAPATRPPLSTVREAEPPDIEELAREAATETNVVDLSRGTRQH